MVAMTRSTTFKRDRHRRKGTPLDLPL